MKRFASVLLVTIIALAALSAHATLVTATFTSPVGSWGTSTATVNGIGVTGYYWNSTTHSWVAANLFGRNETNDHGVGVCDPNETANCGTGSGGGDFNELSNENTPEIIRLTLPTGDTWASLQLSSLDNNASTNTALYERGVLWADSNGTPNGGPGAIGDSAVCTFGAGGLGTCSMSGTSLEPVINLSGVANSHYLFLEATDWSTACTVNHVCNTNNDFLLEAASVNAPEPSSLILFGSGLTAAAGFIRRRIRK